MSHVLLSRPSEEHRQIVQNNKKLPKGIRAATKTSEAAAAARKEIRPGRLYSNLMSMTYLMILSNKYLIEDFQKIPRELMQKYRVIKVDHSG